MEMVYCVSMTMAKYSVYIGLAWAWRTTSLVMTEPTHILSWARGGTSLLPVTLPATSIEFLQYVGASMWCYCFIEEMTH